VTWLRLAGDRFVPAAETPRTVAVEGIADAFCAAYSDAPVNPRPPPRRPRSYGCWDGDELAGCEHLDAEEDAAVLDALRDAGEIE